MNLAKLAEFGIKATVTQAGKLHIEAPKGAITPELRQEISQNRDFLLAEMNMMNFMNIKSSCTAPRARAYTGDGHVHIPGKPGFDELHEHDELQNHMYGPAHAHIYPESHVHHQAANDSDSTAKDAYCWPHSDAMNGSELTTMATRLERFARLELAVDDAERLADRLMRRDRDHDDRHACLECASLSGSPSAWRCWAFRQRGARGLGLPHGLAGMLQRCQAFTDGEPSASGYTPARPADEPRLAHLGRAPGPWLAPSEKVAADAYHQHHGQCQQCQAAGRGYTSRCSAGVALWDQYQGGATQ